MSRSTDVERARSWFSGAEGYEGPGDAEALADLIAKVRAEALEEAAKACDDLRTVVSAVGPLHTAGLRDGSAICVTRIRALKESP